MIKRTHPSDQAIALAIGVTGVRTRSSNQAVPTLPGVPFLSSSCAKRVLLLLIKLTDTCV